MALSDLLRAIEDDARQERLRADHESARAAADIIERARYEAAALEAELTKAPEQGALAEGARLRAAARLDAAALMRDTLEDGFASVLRGMRSRLAQQRALDSYSALFRALLEESRAALPEATELRVDPRDAELAATLAGGLRVVAALSSWGGLELAAGDGRAVLNTLEERLANAEQLLRRRFADWLATVNSPVHGP